MKKNIVKISCKYGKIYFSMIIIFLMSLFVVTLLPQKNIKTRLQNAYKEFEKKQIIIPTVFSYISLDNFTDAVMINAIYTLNPVKPIDSMLLVRVGYEEGKEMQETKILRPYFQMYNLLTNKNSEYVTYGRYWHGYIVYLKPLLIIFNYKIIRIIFMSIINLLSMWYLYLIYKKVGLGESLIMLMSLIIAGFFVAGLSLTYFPVLAISLIMSIICLLKKEIKYEYMFIVGGLTSFFDLLTAPLLTIGLPLLTLVLNQNKNKKILLFMFNWVAGYGIMWASKWIITDLLTNEHIIKNAIETAVFRMGNKTENEKFTYLTVIFRNLQWVGVEFISIIILTLISIFLVKKEKQNFNNEQKEQIKSYIIIALLPFLWYFVMKNHSYSHARFTYRILLLTFASLGLINYKIMKTSVEKNKIDKIKEKR